MTTTGHAVYDGPSQGHREKGWGTWFMARDVATPAHHSQMLVEPKLGLGGFGSGLLGPGLCLENQP